MVKVLIADDSYIMRKSLSAIFKNKGYTVVAESTNGKEACLDYAKHLPDIVTMDINMPVMNGIEAVKKIIEKFPDAKIIMISAEGQRGMVYQALKEGAKHYIVKPITKEKLISVVCQLL